LKLLEKINFANVPNFKNIDGSFKNPYYDVGNQYSVPYLWGTTGIIINKKYVDEDSDSWSILWNSSYSGKISMLNNQEEVIAAGLKSLGYTIAGQNDSQLEDVLMHLLDQKPLLRGYEDPVKIRTSMASEELWAAHLYSGDAIQMISINSNLKFIIPKEGAVKWTDNLAIPVGAKNKENAEKFIDFILRADVGAQIANYQKYATANNAAKEFVDEQILNDHSIYPSAEIIGMLEPLSLNFKSEYNRIWSRLQVAG